MSAAASHAIMLAIETSQRGGEVALRDAAGAVHVEHLRSEGRRDDDLMTAIERVTDRVGIGAADLQAVAVSIGPGGFTGLRIAVSTVKMLAEALGVAVVAIPSALVAAASHDGPGPVLVALAAKRGTMWVTRLVRGDGAGFTIDGAPGIVDAGGLDLEGVTTVLADEHFPPDARSRCVDAGVPVVDPAFHAAACLEVGAAMLKTGATSDPLALAPIYPRPPEAVTQWARRAAGPDAATA